MDDLELWSIADLMAVKKGSFKQYVARFIKLCDGHVMQCEVRTNKDLFDYGSISKHDWFCSSAWLGDTCARSATVTRSCSLGTLELFDAPNVGRVFTKDVGQETVPSAQGFDIESDIPYAYTFY